MHVPASCMGAGTMGHSSSELAWLELSVPYPVTENHQSNHFQDRYASRLCSRNPDT